MAVRDEVAELYDVAEDWEVEVLDGLRRRAGQVWDCDAGGDGACWTNPASASACEHCGRARPAAGVPVGAAAIGDGG